jgi:hypothetical protein
MRVDVLRWTWGDRMQHAASESIMLDAAESGGIGHLDTILCTPLARLVPGATKRVADRIKAEYRRPSAVKTAMFNSGI